MSEAQQLVAAVLTLWIVCIGIGWVVGGPQGGRAVFLWPLRTGFQLIRQIIGGILVGLGNLFIALGRFVRGGNHQPHNRRRH